MVFTFERDGEKLEGNGTDEASGAKARVVVRLDINIDSPQGRVYITMPDEAEKALAEFTAMDLSEEEALAMGFSMAESSIKFRTSAPLRA